MKTKTFGSYTYMVVKYFVDEDGVLDVVIERWNKAKYAFNDCEKHRVLYGADMAHVFKAKQCIQIK